MNELEMLNDYLSKKKSLGDIYDLMNVQTASPSEPLRDPASAKPSPWDKLAALPDKNPQPGSSAELPQKQPMVLITPQPEYQGAIKPYADVPKSDVGKFTMDNINDAIDVTAGLRDQAQKRMDNVNNQSEKYRANYSNTINSLGDAFKEYVPNADRQSQILELTKGYKQAETPDRDMWAQAILSIGPAFLGGLTGSAGMKAAHPAQKEAQAMYEVTRKEQLAKGKQSKDEIKAKIDALKSLEKQDQDAFYKNQNNIKTAMQLKLQAEANLVNASDKDKPAAQKAVDDLNKLIPKEAIDGTNSVVKADLEQQKVDVQKNKAAKSGSSKVAPGQAALDREFAKTYQQYVASGGYSKTQENLNNLQPVLAKLDQMKGTGNIGIMPKAMRDVFFKESAAMQENVEKVITETLRQTFGPQFTEREGRDFINRSYNPKQSPQENATRLRSVISDILTRSKQIEDSAKYFESNGMSLAGYKGASNALPGVTKGHSVTTPQATNSGRGSANMSLADKLKRIKELTKK